MNERTTGTGDALGDAGVDVAARLGRYVIVDMALGIDRDVWREHVVTIYDLGLHIFEELTGSFLTDSTRDEFFERPARVRFHHGRLPSRCRVLEGLLTWVDHASTQQGSLARPGLPWNCSHHRNRSRRDLGAAASGKLVHISAYLGSGHRGTWRHQHCHSRSLFPLQRTLALLRGPPSDPTRYNRCVKWQPPRALTPPVRLGKIGELYTLLDECDYLDKSSLEK